MHRSAPLIRSEMSRMLELPPDATHAQWQAEASFVAEEIKAGQKSRIDQGPSSGSVNRSIKKPQTSNFTCSSGVLRNLNSKCPLIRRHRHILQPDLRPALNPEHQDGRQKKSSTAFRP